MEVTQFAVWMSSAAGIFWCESLLLLKAEALVSFAMLKLGTDFSSTMQWKKGDPQKQA